MNKDLKKLIINCGIFSIPIVMWILTLFVVDPFNYFSDNKVIDEQTKLQSARKLNSLLYNTIAFKNNPTPNIIIGDSRIKRLPIKEIKNITGEEYFILHSNAAKLNEIKNNNSEIKQGLNEVIKIAEDRMMGTKDMLATKGRASFLGERAKGHIDPGARSSQLIIDTICKSVINQWEEK